MSTYRAILFDFFGTLTCSVQRGTQHGRVARALGCDPEALIHALDRSFHLRATGRLGSAEATLRWVGERAGARPSRGQLRAALLARVQALHADTRLRPDAVSTLRALRAAGLRTAVVSDCTHELPAILPCLPVAPLLDARIYSVEMGRCKPDPAMYLAACSALDVEPRDCLYVGDGGSRELTGAEKVGIPAVQLQAPDLAGHLVYDAEADWSGPRVGSLTEVIRLAGPAPTYARDLPLPTT